MSEIKFFIDGEECIAKPGQSITMAAKDNGIYIPTLCDFKGLKPAGTCRVCTCNVNGRFTTACTTEVEHGMHVENNNEIIDNIRKAMIELLYTEGNHQCAICEKSGNCELQAIAYRYQIMVPRFPYLFPVRHVESPCQKILIDINRCIQCMRCVRGVTTPDGKHLFRLFRINNTFELNINPEAQGEITDEIAQKAMELCPVGAILSRGEGYTVPIGQRKFDNKPIGSDIEKK